MFNVYLDNGDIDVNQLDNICYIINKEGTFLRKKIGITDALIKVNNISHLQSSVSSFGKINIPIIPQYHTSRITKFFKWAYNKHNGESIVLIYYDPELDEFDIFPTDQEVSGASAHYQKEGLSHTGYLLVGTIHSHANFGASHSGVDDDDELNFDGVHITIGNVADTYQSISCSVVVNGQRFMYNPEEYLDGITPVNVSESNKVKNNRYLVNGLISSRFNEDWKDKVQQRIKQTYKYQSRSGSPLNSFLFRKFDNDNSHGRLTTHQINQMYGNKQIENGAKDKHQIPCENCIYRDLKSQTLIQDMFDVFDEDEIAYYMLGEDIYDDSDEDEIENSEGER